MNFTQEQISDIVVKPVVAYNEMKAIMSFCQFDCSSLRLRYVFVTSSLRLRSNFGEAEYRISYLSDKLSGFIHPH